MKTYSQKASEISREWWVIDATTLPLGKLAVVIPVYNEEKALQKLEDVLALCHECHEVVHISRTQLFGRGMDAMTHFMQVNGCSQMEFHEALGQANEEYKKRNKIEGWVTDVTWLENRFQIKLK